MARVASRVGGILAKWKEELHPRDREGKFRNGWKLSPGASATISRITAAFQPRSWGSNDESAISMSRQAKRRPRSDKQKAALDYFYSEQGNLDIQSALRADADEKKSNFPPQITTLRGMFSPTSEDYIATKEFGAETFGLTPDRLGEVEEWTGKLVTDKGFQAFNVGDPLPVGGPHVVVHTMVPKGTPAIIRGDGSRGIMLPERQPWRIMQVEQDKQTGNVHVYATVVPESGNKEPSRALGSPLREDEKSPKVEPTPEEMARRGLTPEGQPVQGEPQPAQPVPKGSVAPRGEAGIPGERSVSRTDLSPQQQEQADTGAPVESPGETRSPARQVIPREEATANAEAARTADREAKLLEREQKVQERQDRLLDLQEKENERLRAENEQLKATKAAPAKRAAPAAAKGGTEIGGMSESQKDAVLRADKGEIRNAEDQRIHDLAEKIRAERRGETPAPAKKATKAPAKKATAEAAPEAPTAAPAKKAPAKKAAPKVTEKEVNDLNDQEYADLAKYAKSQESKLSAKEKKDLGIGPREGIVDSDETAVQEVYWLARRDGASHDEALADAREAGRAKLRRGIIARGDQEMNDWERKEYERYVSEESDNLTPEQSAYLDKVATSWEKEEAYWKSRIAGNSHAEAIKAARDTKSSRPERQGIGRSMRSRVSKEDTDALDIAGATASNPMRDAVRAAKFDLGRDVPREEVIADLRRQADILRKPGGLKENEYPEAGRSRADLDDIGKIDARRLDEIADKLEANKPKQAEPRAGQRDTSAASRQQIRREDAYNKAIADGDAAEAEALWVADYRSGHDGSAPPPERLDNIRKAIARQIEQKRPAEPATAPEPAKKATPAKKAVQLMPKLSPDERRQLADLSPDEQREYRRMRQYDGLSHDEAMEQAPIVVQGRNAERAARDLEALDRRRAERAAERAAEVPATEAPTPAKKAVKKAAGPRQTLAQRRQTGRADAIKEFLGEDRTGLEERRGSTPATRREQLQSLLRNVEQGTASDPEIRAFLDSMVQHGNEPDINELRDRLERVMADTGDYKIPKATLLRRRRELDAKPEAAGRTARVEAEKAGIRADLKKLNQERGGAVRRRRLQDRLQALENLNDVEAIAPDNLTPEEKRDWVDAYRASVGDGYGDEVSQRSANLDIVRKATSRPKAPPDKENLDAIENARTTTDLRALARDKGVSLTGISRKAEIQAKLRKDLSAKEGESDENYKARIAGLKTPAAKPGIRRAAPRKAAGRAAPADKSLDLYSQDEVDKLGAGLDKNDPATQGVVNAEGRRRAEALLDDIDQMVTDEGSDKALLARLKARREAGPARAIDDLTEAVESGDRDRVRQTIADLRARITGRPAKKVAPAAPKTHAPEDMPDAKPAKVAKAAPRRRSVADKARDEKTGEALHEDWRESWRKQYEANHKAGKPGFESPEVTRPKKTTDKDWIERHGTDDVDIYKTKWADLPEDWQRENRDAAITVNDILKREGGTVDLNDPETRLRLGEEIHQAWLERNKGKKGEAWYDALDVPFADLPPDEQRKDLRQLEVALQAGPEKPTIRKATKASPRAGTGTEQEARKQLAREDAYEQAIKDGDADEAYRQQLADYKDRFPGKTPPRRLTQTWRELIQTRIERAKPAPAKKTTAKKAAKAAPSAPQADRDADLTGPRVLKPDLVRIARREGVPNPNSKTKAQLIEEIKRSRDVGPVEPDSPLGLELRAKEAGLPTTIAGLHKAARADGIAGINSMSKHDLIRVLLDRKDKPKVADVEIPMSRSEIDNLTPASIREAAKQEGFPDLKGDTVQDLLDDYLRQKVLRERPDLAKKVSAKKVTPKAEPGGKPATRSKLTPTQADELFRTRKSGGDWLNEAQEKGFTHDKSGNITVPDAARPALIQHLKNRRDIAAENLDDEQRGGQKLDRVQRARYRIEQLGAEKLLADLGESERPAPKKAAPPKAEAPKVEPEKAAIPRGPIGDTTERAKAWGREHGWTGNSGGWVSKGDQRVQGWDELYRTRKADIDKWEQDRLKARNEALHQRDVAKAAKKAAPKFLPPLDDGTQRKTATNLEEGDIIRVGGNKGELGQPSAVTKIEHRPDGYIDITRADGTKITAANANTTFWIGTKPRKGERFQTPAAPEPARKTAPPIPKDESEIIRRLAGEEGITASRLEKVAEALDIPVPEGMRAKTALQLHIGEEAAKRGITPDRVSAALRGVSTPKAPEPERLPRQLSQYRDRRDYARKYEHMSREDFDALPEAEREEILTNLRKIVEIRDTRTTQDSMRSTVRGGEANHVPIARNAVSRFTRPIQPKQERLSNDDVARRIEALDPTDNEHDRLVANLLRDRSKTDLIEVANKTKIEGLSAGEHLTADKIRERIRRESKARAPKPEKKATKAAARQAQAEADMRRSMDVLSRGGYRDDGQKPETGGSHADLVRRVREAPSPQEADDVLNEPGMLDTLREIADDLGVEWQSLPQGELRRAVVDRIRANRPARGDRGGSGETRMQLLGGKTPDVEPSMADRVRPNGMIPLGQLRKGDRIMVEKHADGKWYPTTRVGAEPITVDRIEGTVSEGGFRRTTNRRAVIGHDRLGNEIRVEGHDGRGYPGHQTFRAARPSAAKKAAPAKKAVPAKAAPAATPAAERIDVSELAKDLYFPKADQGLLEDIQDLLDGKHREQIGDMKPEVKPTPQRVAKYLRSTNESPGSPYHRAVIIRQLGEGKRPGETEEEFKARQAEDAKEIADLRKRGEARKELADRLDKIRSPRAAKKAAEAPAEKPTIRRAAAKKTTAPESSTPPDVLEARRQRAERRRNEPPVVLSPEAQRSLDRANAASRRREAEAQAEDAEARKLSDSLLSEAGVKRSALSELDRVRVDLTMDQYRRGRISKPEAGRRLRGDGKDPNLNKIADAFDARPRIPRKATRAAPAPTSIKKNVDIDELAMQVQDMPDRESIEQALEGRSLSDLRVVQRQVQMPGRITSERSGRRRLADHIVSTREREEASRKAHVARANRRQRTEALSPDMVRVSDRPDAEKYLKGRTDRQLRNLAKKAGIEFRDGLSNEEMAKALLDSLWDPIAPESRPTGGLRKLDSFQLDRLGQQYGLGDKPYNKLGRDGLTRKLMELGADERDLDRPDVIKHKLEHKKPKKGDVVIWSPKGDDRIHRGRVESVSRDGRMRVNWFGAREEKDVKPDETDIRVVPDSANDLYADEGGLKRAEQIRGLNSSQQSQYDKLTPDQKDRYHQLRDEDVPHEAALAQAQTLSAESAVPAEVKGEPRITNSSKELRDMELERMRLRRRIDRARGKRDVSGEQEPSKLERELQPQVDELDKRIQAERERLNPDGLELLSNPELYDLARRNNIDTIYPPDMTKEMLRQKGVKGPTREQHAEKLKKDVDRALERVSVADEKGPTLDTPEGQEQHEERMQRLRQRLREARERYEPFLRERQDRSKQRLADREASKPTIRRAGKETPEERDARLGGILEQLDAAPDREAGHEIIKGLNKQELRDALAKAGYPAGGQRGSRSTLQNLRDDLVNGTTGVRRDSEAIRANRTSLVFPEAPRAPREVPGEPTGRPGLRVIRGEREGPRERPSRSRRALRAVRTQEEKDRNDAELRDARKQLRDGDHETPVDVDKDAKRVERAERIKAAQEATARRERAGGMAALATDLENVIESTRTGDRQGTFNRVVRNRLIGVQTPESDRDAFGHGYEDLRKALGAPERVRDPEQLRTELRDYLETQGIRVGGRRGDRVLYDPEQHRELGNAGRIQPGEPVQIYHASITYTDPEDHSVHVLRKAVVTKLPDEPPEPPNPPGNPPAAPRFPEPVTNPDTGRTDYLPDIKLPKRQLNPDNPIYSVSDDGRDFVADVKTGVRRDPDKIFYRLDHMQVKDLRRVAQLMDIEYNGNDRRVALRGKIMRNLGERFGWDTQLASPQREELSKLTRKELIDRLPKGEKPALRAKKEDLVDQVLGDGPRIRGHATEDSEIGRLRKMVDEDNHHDVRHFGNGLMGQVTLIEDDATGEKAVRKRMRDDVLTGPGDTQADAENLGARVIRAVGGKAPAVFQPGSNVVYQDYIEGRLGSKVSPEALQRAVESDAGRRLHLADLILGNLDRHQDNIIIDKDGNPVGIDHALAFRLPSARARGGGAQAPAMHSEDPFLAHYGAMTQDVDLDGAADNPRWARRMPFSRQELLEAKRSYEQLLPEFEARDKMEWYEQGLQRIDAMIARAPEGGPDVARPAGGHRRPQPRPFDRQSGGELRGRRPRPGSAEMRDGRLTGMSDDADLPDVIPDKEFRDNPDGVPVSDFTIRFPSTGRTYHMDHGRAFKHDGVVYMIESDGFDYKSVMPVMDVVRDEVRQVPPEVQRLQRAVMVLQGANPEDVIHKQRLGPDFFSYAAAGQGVTTFYERRQFPNADEPQLRNAFLHEMAHHIDEDTGWQMSKSPEYYSAAAAGTSGTVFTSFTPSEQVGARIGFQWQPDQSRVFPNGLSDYGQDGGDEEDLADAFSLYFAGPIGVGSVGVGREIPVWFRDIWPARAALFDQKFPEFARQQQAAIAAVRAPRRGRRS